MFEDPAAKKAAIGAGIGAVVAIPLPFIGPIIGASRRRRDRLLHG